MHHENELGRAISIFLEVDKITSSFSWFYGKFGQMVERSFMN